jgi:PAS domain S-box-containing protein
MKNATKNTAFIVLLILIALSASFLGGTLRSGSEPWMWAISILLTVSALIVAIVIWFKYKREQGTNRSLSAHVDEIKLTEAIMETLISSIPDLIFVKDVNGNFYAASESFAQYTDVPRNEIVGSTDEELFGLNPEIYKAYEEDDRLVAYSGKAKVTEERIYSPHYGIEKLFETIKVPLLLDGKAFGILGISRDITERANARKLLNDILNSIDSNIYVKDAETDEILFANESMTASFGSRENIIGKKCWEILRNNKCERCENCTINNLDLQSDQYVKWEDVNPVDKRHYRHLACYIDWAGDRRAVLQYSVDITELKIAKEQAESSNRAKGDFLSRMSHEMRTPMNAIIGMTTIARSTDEDGRKNYCLEKIDGASKHLLGLINDVLDMSKIEAGKFVLTDAEFQFEHMLQKVVDIVSFRMDEKSQVFELTVDKRIPWAIVADEQRLSQVLTNLLANATKFTQEYGSIALDIKLEKMVDDVCTIRFSVTDNGIGISPEQLRIIFRPFEQADGGTSRRFEGTGLGLVISKSIVNLMGGNIEVSSKLDEGSSFSFTVNVKKGQAEPECEVSPEIEWEKLKVLVVDDSREILDYFDSLSSLVGFHCDCAQGGAEAMELASKSQGYDIVFVDWKMPGIDGIELTRQLKQVIKDKTVIIMISGFEWAGIESDAISAGISRFLAKPLFTSTIIDCITECVKMSKTKHSDVILDNNECYHGRRILLAEDIEINREITMALLDGTGLEIDCAENGLIAVELFEKNPETYDLILMDIHMPFMDGLEATIKIRGMDLERAKTIPIIAMTANVFKEDVDKCLESGMNAHIGKPIDIVELYDKLDTFLPRKS